MANFGEANTGYPRAVMGEAPPSNAGLMGGGLQHASTQSSTDRINRSSSSEPNQRNSQNPFATPGTMTPDMRSSAQSAHSFPLEDYPPTHHNQYGAYHDSPYQYSQTKMPPYVNNANIDPANIEDDGDDGFMPEPKRKTILSRTPSTRSKRSGNSGLPVAADASNSGLLPQWHGKDRPQVGTAAASSEPAYNAVEQPATNPAPDNGGPKEKSAWLSRQEKGNHKRRWLMGLIIGSVVLLCVIGGIVGGVLGSRNGSGGKSSGSGSTSTGSGSGQGTNNAGDDNRINGDLDLNSAEIKSLMGNPDLHKVFPGIDYTPWGVQYDTCRKWPPSQNNVTRDMAVISQLTNTVRLYGTDCNQTEMVLHSIDRLKLTNMKVWLGVWIDTNTTTNERQLSQLYRILQNTPDRSIFLGAIVGNEALYRAGPDKATSEANLVQILTNVKSNFTSNGWDLPVATSDLGDNWNANLASVSDIVMSNIHPFFAGVSADVAAAWTLNFLQVHDQPLTQGTSKKQIIAETGWPSGGGTDCGGSTGDCTPGQSGAVASVDNMNTFMEAWICPALSNGTEYFW